MSSFSTLYLRTNQGTDLSTHVSRSLRAGLPVTRVGVLVSAAGTEAERSEAVHASGANHPFLSGWPGVPRVKMFQYVTAPQTSTIEPKCSFIHSF